MKVWQLNGALALGVTVLTGGLLTQLTAQAPIDPVAPATQGIPVIFKDYQAGLQEAKVTDKPLFVVFRCER